MNIVPGTYDNILALYEQNPDYKHAVDADKVTTTFENYLDDYSNDRSIVQGVLADTIDRNRYSYKTSLHRDWRDKKVTIKLR